jgi:superfamily II DNA or RNA helicase
MRVSPAALRVGDVVRIRDERWRIERQVPYAEERLIDVTGCDRRNNGHRASFILPHEPLGRLDTRRPPRLVTPARWRHRARRLLADATPDGRALRAAARARVAILPFQLEPALAVTHGVGCRLLIGDDVGLGKTVQAGLVIAEIRARVPGARTLVAVPAALRDQWQRELADRFALPGIVLDAAALARAGDPSQGNPWAVHDLAITSIDYLKRSEVIRALEGLVWDVVVLDEAHALASHSDRAKAASLVATRARTLVMLSATPHGGDEAAFSRLCRLGDLEHRFPLVVFRRTRGDLALSLERRSVWLRIRPAMAEIAMHDALLAYARRVWTATGADHAGRLAMAVLARRACSSAGALADSIERRLAALVAAPPLEAGRQLCIPLGDHGEDEVPWAVLGAGGLPDAGEEGDILRHLLDLARTASRSECKARALARLLRRTTEPAIVFTEYRDTLARLSGWCEGHAPVLLHGGLTHADRRRAIRQFTHGASRLLLATDAASEGLNLHHRCRLVVHLELPWTPLRLEQRIGRVERIGQTRRVHTIQLVAAGTSEQQVVARLLQRMGRIRTTLDGLRDAGRPEQRIARSVLAGDPGEVEPRIETGAALPHGLIAPDLGALAGREAARLAAARARDGHATTGAGDVRPLTRDEWRPAMTAIRRRRSATRCWWIFVHRLADPDGRLLWEQIVGLEAGIPGRAPATPAAVRLLLAADHALVGRALLRARHTGALALAGALDAGVALALDREQALMRRIASDGGRLAGHLLQPGLFDRRAERAAAAQAAVRDQALAICRARIRGLEAMGSPVSEACDLALAVAIG